MQTRSKIEFYEDFIRTLEALNQRDRNLTNRRMLNVFIWCFLAPVVVSVLLIIFWRLGVITKDMRGYLDWTVLLFPVAYSVWVLGWEVLKDFPSVLRRGAISNVMKTAIKEARWREETCQKFKQNVTASANDWNWIYSNFRMELSAMKTRTKYLTVLAGAVFFLILEGIDVITPSSEVTLNLSPQTLILFFYAAIDEFSRMIALGFVLVLLYLSGSQQHSSLERYLNCLELIVTRP